MIDFSPPDIQESDVRAVADALRSGWITTGPRTKLLERRLEAYVATGQASADAMGPDVASQRAKHTVCLNCATAAEELNLRVLGVGPGDEVIVPAYTYTATASAAIHCGATVVFADIQRDGDAATHAPEMDYERLERLLTPRTKAIVAVDFGGVMCDYDRLFAVAEQTRHNYQPKRSDGTPLGELASQIQKQLGRVAVVADCAHALGAHRIVGGQSVCAGGAADFSSFSFHAVKNLTTAEGGASTWRLPGIDDAQLYDLYQLLSLHGQSKDALGKASAGQWEYDVVGPWYKCNMTDVAAALGLSQLDRYPELLRRRAQIVQAYDAACDELGIDHLRHLLPSSHSSMHLYTVRIPGIDAQGRNALMAKLAERGISTNVHYKPLPLMSAYRALGWDIKDFPNSYDYYQNLITLPLHTQLSDADVAYVCDALGTVVRGTRGTRGAHATTVAHATQG